MMAGADGGAATASPRGRFSVPPPGDGCGAAGGYPVRAPSSRAICRQASRCGVARGRCRTRRRAERTTCTPSLSSRSRSQLTRVRAQAVRAARSRSSCMSTYAAAVSRTRNWFAEKREQLVRSICRPSSNSLIRFSMSPAGAVDLLVDEARRLPHVRHHEARVVPRLAVAEADDFRLDHHPARATPRARRITGVGVDVRRLPAHLTRRRYNRDRLSRRFGSDYGRAIRLKMLSERDGDDGPYRSTQLQ